MKSKFILVLRIVAASILMQTLYFKFSGAPESVYIFSSLGMEPWGRWFAGLSELAASLLLLVPLTQYLGAAMGLGIMLGALASHIFVLGVVVQNDGGLLFGLALLVLACCTSILILSKKEILAWSLEVKGLLQRLSKKAS